jgi:hypothetical protein
MARTYESSARRPRISIDVHPDLRRRRRLAAARADIGVREYVLDAIEDRLRQDLTQLEDNERALMAASGPVLAELWDNDADAAYDRV